MKAPLQHQTPESLSYTAQEKLRDGRTVIIRAIRHDDKALLQELMRHLSPMSRYFRFFTFKDTLTEGELASFTELDFISHVGLLASVTKLGVPVPVGTGRYFVSKIQPDDVLSAELSFVVEEEFQGLGIATILLRHLVEIARSKGIVEFCACVLADNQKMMNVFAGSRLPMTQSLGDHGVIEVRLSLSISGHDTSIS
jgi:GNAT superfamily N-acetyltransferase